MLLHACACVIHDSLAFAQRVVVQAEGPCYACTTTWQSRGADPSIRTEDYDPYLNPGKKLAIEVALDEDEIRGKLKALDKKYAKVAPHNHAPVWLA